MVFVKMDSSRTETVYCKGTEGDYRLILWNYPKDVILPNFINDFNFNVNVEEQITNTEDLEDSVPDVTEKTLFYGVPCGLLKELYIHIRGINDMPSKLIYTAYRAMETMKCGKMDRNYLVQLIGKDKFINFNRVVLWGVYRNTPLGELFSKVTPEKYQTEILKSLLIKFASGQSFNKNEQLDDSFLIMCLACRNYKTDSVLEFIGHLNRKISEITYMCRHCGYLKFTNFCALFYHIFSDNCFKPQYEYCVVCRKLYLSLSPHLTELSKFLDCWKVKCSYCDFIAYSVCSFNLHLGYHIKELPYICPECGEYFSFKSDLEDHMKNECYFDYKFKCYLCTCCLMIFSYLEHYYTHLATEHYQRRVKCVICHDIFPAQRDFLEHRSKFHPDSACRYNVIHYCELCPSSTFRAMSLQKHLSNHSEDISSCIILYKCTCEFYTRHKQKFIEHKKSNRECRDKNFTRPQILKICSKCDDVSSYNYLKPIFLCEECQVIINPVLGLMNYYCETCHLVIDYNWNCVLDHFSFFHKKIDLLSVWHNVQMIIASKKIAPGRYMTRGVITSVDADTLGKVIFSFYAKKISSQSSEIFGINIRNFEKNGSESIENLLIRIRSPETINASVSEGSQDAQAINKPPLKSIAKFNNVKPNNSSTINGVSTSRKFNDDNQSNSATFDEGFISLGKMNDKSKNSPAILGVSSLEKLNTDKPNNTTTAITRNAVKELFHCKVCDFCTLDKFESSIHALTHPSFQCFECEQRFETISERNDHLSEIHGVCLVVENPENVKPRKEVRKILKQQIEGKLSHYSGEKEVENPESDDCLEDRCIVLSDSD